MIRWLMCAVAALWLATPLAAAQSAKPLFAADNPIRITIRGPINTIVRAEPESNQRYAGSLTVAGTAEALPVELAQRGITRRKSDICQFPPLRVTFTTPPPAGSVFAGQRRLKLVTHCRPAANFQQYVLMEYATYRLYNQITPRSFRVRLATIDYQDDGGKPVVSRIGFFIEDIDDVAARTGTSGARMPSRIPVSRLSAADAGRVGVFQYMIGNLDWAMQAGPPGESCCHNHMLVSEPAGIVPVPYDWDYSGLVDTPYATPPDSVRVSSVRQRRYRGFCRFNASARSAIAAIRAQQASLLATFAQVPGLDPRTAGKASAYLGSFFADIATDASAEAKLLKTCL